MYIFTRDANHLLRIAILWRQRWRNYEIIAFDIICYVTSQVYINAFCILAVASFLDVTLMRLPCN